MVKLRSCELSKEKNEIVMNCKATNSVVKLQHLKVDIWKVVSRPAFTFLLTHFIGVRRVIKRRVRDHVEMPIQTVIP